MAGASTGNHDSGHEAGRTGIASQDGGFSVADTAEDRPGDPPCWQCRVCPSCGTLADNDPPTTCQHCGAELHAE